jgi:YfiH family protein
LFYGGFGVTVEILRSGTLAVAGIVHGFTTRLGGVSGPPYESLNLTTSRGDDPEAVAENRRRLRETLGIPVLALVHQVHGRRVLAVEEAPRDALGGAAGGSWTVGEGDALVTDRPGIGLLARTADCAPILLLDPDRPAVAAVHSGWRGAVADVAGAAVAELVARYGSAPSRLLAAIGPSISKESYRVGPEVLEAFADAFGTLDGELIGPVDAEGGATLDVPEAVRRRLVAAGVRPENIERLPYCTYRDLRFYSSRRARSKTFGGQGGIIAIES